MKFTPFSIKSQQFNKIMRGYDPQEVAAFLDKLSDEFEKMNSENDSMKKDLEKAQAKINEYRKIEKNLRDTLLSVNETSNKSMESAKKQSTLILKEAELKAAQMLEKAKEDADAIRNAVENLREEKNVIIARLKAIINSQAGLVEMKLENIDKEEEKQQQTKQEEIQKPENLNINIDDIIEKLL